MGEVWGGIKVIHGAEVRLVNVTYMSLVSDGEVGSSSTSSPNERDTVVTYMY